MLLEFIAKIKQNWLKFLKGDADNKNKPEVKQHKLAEHYLIAKNVSKLKFNGAIINLHLYRYSNESSGFKYMISDETGEHRIIRTVCNQYDFARLSFIGKIFEPPILEWTCRNDGCDCHITNHDNSDFTEKLAPAAKNCVFPVLLPYYPTKIKDGGVYYQIDIGQFVKDYIVNSDTVLDAETLLKIKLKNGWPEIKGIALNN